MRLSTLIIIIAAALASCSRQNVQQPSPGAKRYQLQGKVMSVNKAARTAKIQHEAIEGYMDSMTMDFPIHADWVWDVLQPGAEIRADLVVDKKAKEPFYLENVGIIASADSN